MEGNFAKAILCDGCDIFIVSFVNDFKEKEEEETLNLAERHGLLKLRISCRKCWRETKIQRRSFSDASDVSMV